MKILKFLFDEILEFINYFIESLLIWCLIVFYTCVILDFINLIYKYIN